ncbi:uncharacterized protein LOC117536851 [Gymnodraco acuticeps]|uniref:Uncharacterized protein LOC117536851 n=2 Tax=Notothenioidei TaxID=8205 RepID=A0A6P8TJB5_GYMAC|nr:uncharacterized protein LOC117536851 [Gymnodraco acuticeps]
MASTSECSISGGKGTAALDYNWHYSFNIPWNLMPSHIKKILEKKEWPTARDRREIIRLISAEIVSFCKNPQKKHLSEVARKMVVDYPKSFKDEIENQVVGCGYDSITKQLQCRVDNYKRLELPTMTHSSSADKGKKRRRKDAYGCVVNPEPQLSANCEAQKNMKGELHKMFEGNEKGEKKIEALMMNTFASQKRDVQNEKDTQTLKEEWPYLFTTTGLKTHFKELTGVHINHEFQEDMKSKYKRVLGYLKSQRPARESRAAKLLPQIQGNPGEDSCGALLLLLAHFKEDQHKMLINVDDTCVATDVDLQHLPTTPCILLCGESPMTASAFMVAVDQVVVNDRIFTFTEAVNDMFMIYYVLNIDYPVELGATMEFIQRCIFRINPDKGSKVQKQGNKKRLAVNPKVDHLNMRA